MKVRRFVFILVALAVALLVAVVILYAHYFGPVDMYAQQTDFIVNPDQSADQIIDELRQQGFIHSRLALEIALNLSNPGKTAIRSGGYELSASMDTWSIAHALLRPPYLVFFTFPPGWRKEQIADKLTQVFGWTETQKEEWLNVDTDPSADYIEGVYAPDTYLIPSDQTPAQVADRFRERFQEDFAPYASEATAQNLPWTEVVTIASLIEREAGSTDDMPIIAGIIFNRLKAHMPLQIDATLQYAVGTDADWWPTPTPEDKLVTSPFNTYLHAGLPPHPIDEPSLAAINAVLNPTKTSCIYYLHDPTGQIHCSATYAGQLANIQKYLK